MAIPKSVLEAAKAAEQIVLQAPGQQAQQPVVQPQGQQVQQPVVQQPMEGQQAQPPVVPPVETVKPDQAQEPRFKFQDYLEGLDDVRNDATVLYDRISHLGEAHKVLHGKYRSEVPRFAERVRSLEQENEALKSEIATLRAGGASRQTEASAAQAQPGPQRVLNVQDDDIDLKALGYTQEQIEDFGEDLLKKQVAIHRSIVQQEMRPIQSQIQQTAATTFEAQVREKVPNVNDINHDPDFAAFIDQPVSPFVPITLKEVLQDAISRGDVEKTASIFKSFSGANVQARSTHGPESQVVPASRGGGPIPQGGQTQGRIYTGLEYRNLATQIATGRIKGDQAKAMKQELDAAMIQGRVRG